MKTVSSSKGTLYNFSARLIFVLSSYFIHILLGRHLGPERYGIFGIVIALFNLWFIFLSNGLREAISKYIAEFKNLALAIYKKALFLQVISSLLLTSIFLLSAKKIATFLGDINLAGYFRFSSLILPLSSVYFIALGKFNGQKRFGREALVMSIYYILRAMGIIGFVLLLDWGINGALGGIFFASLITCFLSIILCRDKAGKNSFPVKKLIFFALPILSFFLGINLIMNLDLIFVKKLMIQEKFTGFYTAALTIARVPYFLFYAFSATLLPTISRSFTNRNLPLVRNYINQYLRYLLLSALPVTVLISAKASNLVSLLYGTKYEASGSPLSIIIFGMFFLSLFMLLATVLFSIGKPKLTLSIQAFLLPLDLLLIYFFIPRFGLPGAAWATTLATLTGVLSIYISITKRLQIIFPLYSFIKIISANIIIYFISKFFALQGFPLLFFFVISLLIYGLLLWLFKEIKKEDLKLIKGMIT